MLWKFFVGLVVSFFVAVPIVRAEEIFMKDLRYGSKGDAVIELQEFLTDEKIYTGPISGSFYSLTRTAVRKFQKREKLKQTGLWDKKTRERASQIFVAEMEEDESEEETQSSRPGSSTLPRQPAQEPVWPWLMPTAPAAKAPITARPSDVIPRTTEKPNTPTIIDRLLKPIVDWLTPTIPTSPTVPAITAPSTFATSTSTIAPTPSTARPVTCGNGTCDNDETGQNCSSDCGPRGACSRTRFNNLTNSAICNASECPTGCVYNYLGCPSGCNGTTSTSSTTPITMPPASTGDATPPVITNQTPAPGSPTPTFTWITNESATGELKMDGLTYVTPLGLSHRVTIGVLPTGGYPYTITAVDGSNNSATINGWMTQACGDNSCNWTENATDCPSDCRAGCGDGICASDETDTTCSQDCSYCGGGFCSKGQTCVDAATRTCCKTGEYFCSNGCSATPCVLPTCTEGPIPSTGCLCQGINKFSGYCCNSKLSNSLVWTNVACTQTCANAGGVCCLGGSSDCKGSWSGQWATDCQGYVCCIGTCTGTTYGAAPQQTRVAASPVAPAGFWHRLTRILYDVFTFPARSFGL